MAVFRVERNTGYTVMSNHHLRNKELSLKAKGLLSQMLSLPEDWDYTLAGLSYINRESIDAIRTAVWELEKAGYITRRQGRDEKGKMTAIEYTIYEQPQPPELDCPVLEKPTADNPILENPTTDNPTSENPTQLNKDRSRTNLSKKEKSITDLSNTDSFPILSPDPSPCRAAPERKGTEAFKQSAVDIYREIIMENIEYDTLTQNPKMDKERLDEIVDLMLETVCSARKTLRIAGDDYPAELVKTKFLKLNSSHIEFVMDCMRENTTKIRNIKQNLIDVCADFLQLGGHCFHVAVIQPDHIAVYEHFPRINGKKARSHLLHFTLDHCPFLGSHRNAQHNIPRSVCHLFTVLSAPNKGLGLSQQAKHRQALFRECGYTPYACYGISLTTITATQPQFGKLQANFFKRKTP